MPNRKIPENKNVLHAACGYLAAYKRDADILMSRFFLKIKLGVLYILYMYTKKKL